MFLYQRGSVLSKLNGNKYLHRSKEIEIALRLFICRGQLYA